ncbi:hypothetical protein vseg_017680 [Gypsophila vaccaria]
MARKSSHQRHREISLRGRNVTTTRENASMDEPTETTETTETEYDSVPGCAGILRDHCGKTKDINAITGIPELIIETEEEDEAVNEPINGKDSHPEQSFTNSKTETSRPVPVLQLQLEDVEEEIEFWSQAIVCYIMGANPPWEIIEGFVRRIWSKFNIDKISFMPNGIFLGRFKTKENQEQVLQSGHYLFDNKPLIYRPWSKELELKKTKIDMVPVWIQLHNLPLKFWGKSLPKIAGLLGKHIKNDMATEERSKIGYARVMVELKIDQQLPAHVSFKDETGLLVSVGVEYEWKPVTCINCHGMGHTKEECRKNVEKAPLKPAVKQVWKPITKKPECSSKPTEIKQNATLNPVRQGNVVQDLEDEGGYSPNKFGSVSYRDALSPSSQLNIPTAKTPNIAQTHG